MLRVLLDDEEVDVSMYESYVSDHFNDEFEREWFQDPYVQRIIKEIDSTEVMDGVNLYNEFLGSIPPEYLSSGCKGLILIYKENVKLNGDHLGDNCIPILMELAEVKDVEITLRHIPKFPKDVKLYVMNTSKTITSYSIVDKVTFIEGDSGVGKTQFSQRAMSSALTVTTAVSNGFDLTVLSRREFNRSLSIAKRNIEKYTGEKFPVNDKDKAGKLLFTYWSEEDNFPIFDSIIIIDDEDFISSREFSAYFNADKYNYYIIINRREVAGINYSIDSIFKFKTDGIHHWLEKSISYDVVNTKSRKTVDWVLVEGSASDFIFFSEMFQSERVINPSYKGTDVTSGRAK